MTSDEVQRVKRDAVLKEAGRAFSKRGFHNTSLDDVARALGVSKGTLYNYVRDKQEILFEFHNMARDIGNRAFEYGRERGGTGAEVLRNIMICYIRLLTEELGACGALTEVDALRPEDRAVAVKNRDAFERGFIAVIKSGIADGSIREIDPKLAVFTFMGAFNWLPRWFSPEGRVTGAEIAEQMSDLLLRGLMSSKTAAQAGAAVSQRGRAAKRPAGKAA
jgi:AcrR family transcriptional regulator